VFANLLIGLREGLEAALVVSILVAYLVRTDRRDRLPAVWLGVGVAVGLSLAVGALMTFTSDELSYRASEGFGGGMSIVAVGFVTWMIFWMRRAARSMKAELHHRLDRAIAVGTGALVATAFVAVAREGLETAVFVWTAVRSTGEGAEPLIGVILGLGTAVLLAWLLYRRAISFNLGRFFTWTGAGLVVVAAGVLAYGIGDLQEIGALPGDESIAFDISGTIAPDSVPGTLLGGIFNLHPTTTWLQAIAWLAYLVPVMYLFLRPQRTVRQQAAAPAATPAGSTAR